MRFQANVVVRLKNGVLDPQGQTIREAARALGFSSLGEVRVGKQFALDLEARDAKSARAQLDQLCHKLLANPVIETYGFEIINSKPSSPKVKR